jgi:hypothetical protein
MWDVSIHCDTHVLLLEQMFVTFMMSLKSAGVLGPEKGPLLYPSLRP